MKAIYLLSCFWAAICISGPKGPESIQEVEESLEKTSTSEVDIMSSSSQESGLETLPGIKVKGFLDHGPLDSYSTIDFRSYASRGTATIPNGPGVMRSDTTAVEEWGPWKLPARIPMDFNKRTQVAIAQAQRASSAIKRTIPSLGIATIGTPGIVICNVEEKSAAKRLGLRTGDFLLKVGDAWLYSPRDLSRELNQTALARLTILRDGVQFEIVVDFSLQSPSPSDGRSSRQQNHRIESVRRLISVIQQDGYFTVTVKFGNPRRPPSVFHGSKEAISDSIRELPIGLQADILGRIANR